MAPTPIEKQDVVRLNRDTLYLQADSPGKDKESNWLPVPKGPFFVVLRIYWPKAEALDGTWGQPPLVKVQKGGDQ